MLMSATVANGSCIWKTMAVSMQPCHITPNTALLISSCDTFVLSCTDLQTLLRAFRRGGLSPTQF